MSVHVLLNLLNELKKNNTRARMLDSIKITLIEISFLP